MGLVDDQLLRPEASQQCLLERQRAACLLGAP